MDIVLINVKPGSYDIEKAMNKEKIEIKGLVNCMGIDGFVAKEFEKASLFELIEHTLTDEQKEIIEDNKQE